MPSFLKKDFSPECNGLAIVCNHFYLVLWNISHWKRTPPLPAEIPIFIWKCIRSSLISRRWWWTSAVIHFIWNNFTPWWLVLFPGRELPLSFFLKKKKKICSFPPLSLSSTHWVTQLQCPLPKRKKFLLAGWGLWQREVPALAKLPTSSPSSEEARCRLGLATGRRLSSTVWLDTGAASREFQGVHQRGNEMKDTTSQRGSSEWEGQGDAQIIHSEV